MTNEMLPINITTETNMKNSSNVSRDSIEQGAANQICAIFAFLLSITGFIVYVFFIVIVFKRRKFNRSPYFIIAGWLGVADCLSLIVTFVYAVPCMMYRDPYGKNYIGGAILNIAWFTSLPMIFFLAVNRYLCICHTELCKKVYTTTSSNLYCLASWTFGISYSIPTFFSCCPLYFYFDLLSWGWDVSEFGTLVLSYGELTMVVLVTVGGFYLNLLVIKRLHDARTSTTPLATDMERRRLARERKVFFQYFITTIWLAVFDVPFITMGYTDPSPALGYFTTMAYIINCSVNGWVYLILNKTIQKEVRAWMKELPKWSVCSGVGGSEIRMEERSVKRNSVDYRRSGGKRVSDVNAPFSH